MDGRSEAGTPSVYEQAMSSGNLAPRTAVVMMLVLTVLLGALSGLVMFPAAQHLRSLQDGERARATLHKAGSCMVGNCQVKFRADGQAVVADLPVGSGGGRSAVGTSLTVRYRADDPQVVAREEDVGGGGAAVLTAVSGGIAVLFLGTSIGMAVHQAGRRRTDART